MFLYLCAAIVTLGIVRFTQIAFQKHLRGLPGPFLARFTGLYRVSLVVRGDAPAQYRRLHEKYGPIVRTGPNHVSIADTSAVPIIYGVGSKFVKADFYKPFAGDTKAGSLPSLFTALDPSVHKALKAPVAQLYSMTNIRTFESYADECTAIFINAMRDLEGQTVDLSVWLQWYAFDVIASITFQRRFGFMEQRRDIDSMINGIDTGLQYVKVITQVPQLHPWLLGNRLLLDFLKSIAPNTPDPIETMKRIAEEEITRYDQKEKRTDRTDFLAQLRAKKSNSDKMNDADLMGHLLNNLLAGSDTTAISLRAIFYYLIKNPRTYRKVVAEIDEADRNGQLGTYVTFEQSLKLPYLQVVLKEAMRLHPGVGFPLERHVPEGGAMICGAQLPSGTNVCMAAPVIHHNKAVYGEDTEVFRPERWLDEVPEKLKAMERNFFAFGHGSRTCIGKNISIMEMGKFVPQILRTFDLEWASAKPEWNVDAAWFWKQTDLIVRFRSRGQLSAHENLAAR